MRQLFLYALFALMLPVKALADGNVAKIGDTEYATLAEAIAAATNGSETTITLIADVNGYQTIPEGKIIKLDLNGRTISDNTAGKSAILNNGTLTVVDSSTGGKIVSQRYVGIGNGNNAKTTFESGSIEAVEGCIITGKAVGSTITINGGTFTNSDNFVIAGNGTKRDGDANTITITGGTFNGQIVSSGYVACGVYSPWKDNVTISGGTFNITNGCGVLARAGNINITGGTFTTTGEVTGKVGDSRVVVPCSAIVYDSQAGYPAMTQESTISISGGSFTSANGVPAVSFVSNSATESHIAVSGGSFSSSLDAAVCAPGFDPAPNGDGTFGVRHYVAQINDNKYEMLTEALSAVTEGQTITLIADINTDATITNENNDNFTINLNGKNWISTAYGFKNDGGTVTFTGEGLVKSTAPAGIAIWARTGSIIIESGDYENCSNEEATVYVGTTAENLDGNQPNITINGGSFKNTASGVYKWNTSLLPLTLNIINNIANDNAYQAITINGGTFYGNDPSLGDDSQIALNKPTKNSNFISPSMHAEKNADGTFGIKEGGYVAQLGYIKYVTFEEALAAAESGTKTLYLLADVTIESLSVVEGKTIDKNGNEITVTNFSVTDGEVQTLPFDFKATNATYTRNNLAGTEWGTVCVPFPLQSCDAYTLYNITNIAADKLTIAEIAETINAGTPVIFKNNSKVSSLTFSSTNVDINAETTAGEAHNLVGTFAAKTIESGLTSIYYINSDAFHQAKVKLTVPTYRAYIQTSGTSAKQLFITISGENATAIGSISLDNASAVESVYDTQGRKLSAPSKGINIIRLKNGKTIKTTF